jgi:glycosyltransferase involved in cell wall biosynthesis
MFHFYFQCDNANHVTIVNKIVSSSNWPSGLSIKLLLLDWDDDARKSVNSRISELGWDVPVIDVFLESPHHIQESYRNQHGQQRHHYLVEMVFVSLKDCILNTNSVLIQFNDVSVRGKVFVDACKHIGMNRMLIQDGFLTFVNRQGRVARNDQNYFWGSTNPEAALVWGNTMVTQLQERHGLKRDKVFVIGPTKNFMDLDQSRRVLNQDNPRVLWVDQALIDQGKVNEGQWLSEQAEISLILQELDTTIRLHPSTTKRTREKLLASITDGIKIIDRQRPLEPKDLSEFDCIVTYFSTVFLDALSAGIPVVLLSTDSIGIRLPFMDHPLMRYCEDKADLIDSVRLAISSANDAHGAYENSEVSNHIANKNGFDEAAAFLGNHAASFRGLNAQVTSGAMNYHDAVALERLNGARVLVYSTSFGNYVGVGKPIASFARRMKYQAFDVELFLVTPRPSKDLHNRLVHSSLVIINSFDVVKTITVNAMSGIRARCQKYGIPILFYVHETEHVLNRRLTEQPEKFLNFLRNVLPDTICLAVSDQQAEWLLTLGAKNVRTVYNSVEEPILDGTRYGSGPGEFLPVKIMMVGTQQRRKGVDLFSQVSDIAADRGLDWEFVWAGSETGESDELYRSKNVRWAGQLSRHELGKELASASCFFLSSVDDPMPLSVGEALYHSVPAVVYRRTGFADFISYNRYGGVYDFYSPQIAFDVLQDVIEDRKRISINRAIIRELIGNDAFASRLLGVLGEVIISAPNASDLSVPQSKAIRRSHPNDGASSESKASVNHRIAHITGSRDKLKRLVKPMVPSRFRPSVARFGRRYLGF